MTSRRTFIALATAGVLGAPLASRAQDLKRRYRIGFLGNSTAQLEANLTGPFRDGLRDLGYVEGRDVEIEYRWAQGHYERFPALIDELLALKVDVMVAAGTPAALALKRATTKVPVVMVAVGDPVNTGLVASLAHPGGNLTGLVSIAPDLEGKRLELLREVVPKLSHVIFLINPSNPFHRSSEAQVRAAAKALSLRVQFAAVQAEADFDPVFDTIAREHPDGLIILADRLFLHHRSRIAEFATRTRLPGVYAYSELVEVGGLMSFGPSYPGMHRRAAYFVHRILNGASPAELPMEQPSQFELIINLRTARTLGLSVPPSVLLRTDRVIE
jgi:putative ABC transport system substrate-binding protein